jgi:Mce-associated membrane protein
MTRINPRRPASSRAPVSRPRRVAGQGSTPTETVEAVEATPVVEDPNPEADASGPSPESPGVETGAERPPQPPAVPDERAGLAALFDSRRATTVLLSVVAVLALVAGGLFAWDALRDDDVAKPSKQPIVIGSDDATAGVDAAAKAAETILTRSYQDYDKQLDDATALMTDAFAKEFRETATEVQEEFVAGKTEQQARVVAQGVAHATRTEVQALVFLNLYVSKDASDTTYTPYRVLVTVLHTDDGWLVSALDTK